MSNAYTVRVNQKLAFARIHVQLWRQADTPATVQSLRESALTHAMGAYQAFLQEIAHFYRLPAHQPVVLEVLKAQLVAQERVSPELNEISDLLAEPTGWLARLTAEYEQLFFIFEQKEKKPEDVTKPEVIDVTLVDAQSLPVSADDCEYYINCLRQLIDRLRESTMSEW